eukprot:GILI01014088.1.p1 GENE.GILI01014088.1~~GILI01014088.1.p1  ORF type:complete len:113 (-),score=13.73 GILI01014088.1:313-651(-)
MMHNSDPSTSSSMSLVQMTRHLMRPSDSASLKPLKADRNDYRSASCEEDDSLNDDPILRMLRPPAEVPTHSGKSPDPFRPTRSLAKIELKSPDMSSLAMRRLTKSPNLGVAV